MAFKITKKELMDCDSYELKRFIRYKLSHLKNDYEFEVSLWSLWDHEFLVFDCDEFPPHERKIWIEFCTKMEKEKDEYSEWT